MSEHIEAQGPHAKLTHRSFGDVVVALGSRQVRGPLHRAVQRRLTTESIWTADGVVPRFPSLQHDIVADVCVIGAGITGLSIAYELVQAGRQVVVLERAAVGGGMTAMTTAHLTTAVDDRYFELEQLHGTEATQLVAAAHAAALDRIETIVRTEAIACSFKRLDGYLTLGAGDHIETLERELEAAQRARVEAVRFMQHEVYPLRGAEPGLVFPQQGRFHPLHYVRGLAEAILGGGGQIYCETPVRELHGASPVHVRTANHIVRANAAVVATNSPINERLPVHTKQASYMTYVIALPIAAGSVADSLRWDTEDPYHYIRLHSLREVGPHDYIIVGGEDHKTGQSFDAELRFARLEEWARERFLTIGDEAFRWSGEIMESVDRLAFIGPSPSEDAGVYLVTGESGVGMTHATIAASIITDAIMGRSNPWAELYDPRRRTYAAAADYLKENLNAAAQYLDWVTPGDVNNADAISPGSAAIIRRGLHKLACYRDENGVLHERSAVCPHLGCIVRWNASERTWDCPCHGSRFDRHGVVISGPASRDLSPPRTD